MDNWKPIETAPIKKGEYGPDLLLFCPGINSWNRYSASCEIVVGQWFGSAWYSDIGEVDQGYESTGAYFELTVIHPTHWMPLPKPPVTA